MRHFCWPKKIIKIAKVVGGSSAERAAFTTYALQRLRAVSVKGACDIIIARTPHGAVPRVPRRGFLPLGQPMPRPAVARPRALPRPAPLMAPWQQTPFPAPPILCFPEPTTPPPGLTWRPGPQPLPGTTRQAQTLPPQLPLNRQPLPPPLPLPGPNWRLLPLPVAIGQPMTMTLPGTPWQPLALPGASWQQNPTPPAIAHALTSPPAP